MRRGERTTLAGAGNLVDLLVVLLGGEIVVDLSRESIVGDALEPVGIERVAADAEHLLEGEHHLDGCAELAAAGRAAVMELLVGGPEAGRKTDSMADDLRGLFRGLQVLIGMGILPPDDRGLEALGEVDAVDAALGGEDVAGGEKAGPVRRLGMQLLAEREQPGLAGAFVEPPDDLQIVSAAPLSPVGPMVQRRLVEMVHLIAEIARQAVDHAGVARRHVILLQDLERHHLGPPVVRLAALETVDIGMVLGGAEIAVLPLRGEDGLDPGLRLGFQRVVIENPGQRQQAVDPVRSPLPGVAVAAEPGVVRAHHLGIDLVEMAGQAVRLPLQLLFKPACGLNGTDGELAESRRGQLGLRRQCQGGQQQDGNEQIAEQTGYHDGGRFGKDKHFCPEK